MSKSKKQENIVNINKPHCNIGTIGHIDHGKTTLTSAITKVFDGVGITKYKDYSNIDSQREEQDRKITISAAHVEYETENRHYTHIDCPGHQDYIKNMITGANQMDGVILVVSLVNGVSVQTTEHVILAKEIGIPYMVVFLNKLDGLHDPGLADLVELEVRELIESYGFSEDTPCIKGSALQAIKGDKEAIQQIKELMNAVDTYIKLPKAEEDKPFLMPTENMLVSPGRGLVVTGMVEQGQIKIEDELELVTSTKVFVVTVLHIEMYHRKMELAKKGDNIGVLLKGVSRKDIKKIKGCMLAAPGIISAYNSFKARIFILSKEEGGREKPFGPKYKPQFFFRLINVTGQMQFDGIDFIKPGENVTLKVHLNKSVLINEGLRFIIREGRKTIGAGVILEVYKDQK